MWILTGSDAVAVAQRRAALLAAAGQEPERIDLADEGSETLFTALESLSLFADRRVVAVENAEMLNEADVARLSTTVSDAYVVMRAATLSTTAAKALARVATIEKHNTPKGKAARPRIVEVARQHGVTLTADVEALLVARASHDLARVNSVCLQLSLVGINRPKAGQVQTLLGTCAPDGVPWAITDALEKRDIAGAITAADDVEPIAALAYLTNQVTLAARIVETGERDSAAIQDAMGVTAFAAARGLWWAKTLKGGVGQALEVLAVADQRAKSQIGGRDALVAAIAGLAGLM